MALSAKAIGPYRYHLLDREPFQETRMSMLWLANALDPQQQQTGKVVVKVARLKEEKFSLANQRAIDNEELWLRKLHHPGVIKLRPIAEEGTNFRPGQEIYRARSSLPGNPWFVVTDYLPGGTLHSLVQERHKLNPSLALQIAQHLAQALAYIHTQGCVHRDFKPRNILFAEKPGLQRLSTRSQPILIDFGIANRQGEQQIIAGTMPWLAPECELALHAGDKLAAAPTIDIYALGLVLYFMLTGQHPPNAVPNIQARLQIQPAELGQVAARHRPALATALTRLISRATQDDPRKRPSAAQFAAEVERLQPYAAATRLPNFANPGSLLQQWPWLIGLLVAIGLVWLLVGRSFSLGGEGGGVLPTATPALANPAGNAAIITPTLTLTPTAVVTTPLVLPTVTNSPAPTATVPPTASPTPTWTPSPTPVVATQPAAQPTSTLVPTLTPTPTPRPRPTFTPTTSPTKQA